MPHASEPASRLSSSRERVWTALGRWERFPLPRGAEFEADPKSFQFREKIMRTSDVAILESFREQPSKSKGVEFALNLFARKAPRAQPSESAANRGRSS